MRFSIVTLAVVAVGVYAQDQPITVGTPPSIVQCQPVLLSWTATNLPIILSIIPGGQAGAAALEEIGTFNSLSTSWTADIAAGTSITIQARDSVGNVQYSSPITIQASSNDSCIGNNSVSSSPSGTGSVTPSSASGSATTPVASVTSSSLASVTSSIVASASSAAGSLTSSVVTTAPATTRPTSSGTTTRPASSSAASASPSASAPANGALANGAGMGFLGLVGLVGAMLF